ncbi:MAG: 4-hydroxybenzoate polyprenyltransferase [Gammaproteobacteria bacterium RIFCSPHIGHO2_12_FULL_42_10]|nr:MAG: 4-hydroxybenzoate polyprenyltransferase [Gammaproteobacteria bacterium RIFCSPHIGHO2_12_FULL_42_10]
MGERNANRFSPYIALARLNKPIGILLLLWPTLWALFLVSNGLPRLKWLIIFIAGTILMRSCGCIVNDLADRNIDPHVARTCMRPLAVGTVSVKAALCLATILCSMSFILVLFCNILTIELAMLGIVWTLFYPFMKRWIAMPQAVLGIAFAWGVPMAFAAVENHVSFAGWFLFLAVMVWVVIYDTMYAMVDRDDDLRIGVQSSAILFGRWDRFVLGCLQILFLLMLCVVGWLFASSLFYYIALIFCAALFIYQQWLVQSRERDQCFAAFLNNHWVGLIIFIAIALPSLIGGEGSAIVSLI